MNSNLLRKVFLLFVAAPPISLGIAKFYSHLFSIWRLGYLDYLVAAGLVLSGLFLFAKPRSRVVLLASCVLIAVELLKATADYRDHYDLFITLIAVAYLSIPIIRFFHATLTDHRKSQRDLTL